MTIILVINFLYEPAARNSISMSMQCEDYWLLEALFLVLVEFRYYGYTL